MDNQFKNLKNQEEFFLIFQGLCSVAEFAFNKLDEDFKNIKTDIFLVPQFKKNIPYLISITLVIMGMRGDYMGFRDNDLLSPFLVEIDGVQYDQKYLYKMNDYFRNRLNKTLDILKELDLDLYNTHKKIWSDF
ncbi:MAG: hypothetical protein EXS49_02040 [Candidatus Pacebacteria bacterium]|nr:hypothetical protein [Candidatus Paceibacterota bacterium]